MTSYTAAYYFDQQPGQDSVSGVVTVDSIEAGHAWLIQRLTAGAHEQSDGFAEVIDTVDDRTVTHVSGSLAAALAELLTYAQPTGSAAAVSPELGGAAGCLRITHSAAGGTLLTGTAAGDGTALILRAARGWNYSRRLGSWFVPRSRDQAPDRQLIQVTVEALQAAGHLVEVDVDEQRRPFAEAEAEADRVDRQQRRVDGLHARATRAAAVEQAADEAHEKLPIWPMGEPLHNGRGAASLHRRQRAGETARAATQDRKSADATAAAAAGATAHRYTPEAVSARIAALHSAIGRDQRICDGSTRTLFIDQATGQKAVDHQGPATGDDRQAAVDRIEKAAEELAHWQQVRAEQLATGDAQEYSKATIGPGDTVQIGQHWWPVIRANQATVTVRTDRGQGKAPYATVRGHRRAG